MFSNMQVHLIKKIKLFDDNLSFGDLIVIWFLSQIYIYLTAITILGYLTYHNYNSIIVVYIYIYIYTHTHIYMYINRHK